MGPGRCLQLAAARSTRVGRAAGVLCCAIGLTNRAACFNATHLEPQQQIPVQTDQLSTAATHPTWHTKTAAGRASEAHHPTNLAAFPRQLESSILAERAVLHV